MCDRKDLRIDAKLIGTFVKTKGEQNIQRAVIKNIAAEFNGQPSLYWIKLIPHINNRTIPQSSHMKISIIILRIQKNLTAAKKILFPIYLHHPWPRKENFEAKHALFGPGQPYA
ncbi:hypothetical protein ACJX0J_011547, partial [Zea mays]